MVDSIVATTIFSPTIGKTLLPSPPLDNARNVPIAPVDAHIPVIIARLVSLMDNVNCCFCIICMITMTAIYVSPCTIR